MIETISKCYCDFCGEEIVREYPESYYRLEFTDMSFVSIEKPDKMKDMYTDLCKSCATSVYNKILECKPETTGDTK